MGRIRELESLILRHKSLYYSGKPEISDFEYDKLEEELRQLDENNSALITVGTEVTGKAKIKHKSKMLSLAKTYNIEELQKWQGEEDIISTFKIDGVSCSLIYKDNKLTQSKTRGDGSFGEDITNKVLWLESIPKQIELSDEIEVRGELFCTEEKFFELSKEMQVRGLEKPTSQRNIVAGLVSRKDHIDLCRFLSFQAFELIQEKDFVTELEKFKTINHLGFDIPEVNYHKNNKLDVSIETARDFMAQGNYQIDGLVFTYNKISLHRELGYTAHHPRYKMAFKFAGEAKQTKIKSIEWSVSRNGIMTPVAHVDPVELSGALISRVTLHNYGIVEQYQLKKNDTIEIIRSGEVIPKFLSVVESSKEKFEVPKRGCAQCILDLEIENIRLFCRNSICPGREKESLLNFIQKIGIEDLSSKRLEGLMNKGLVKTISDIYRLTKDDLLKMEKVKDKLSDKIIENIQAAKEIDLITFLSALGITGGAYNKCEKVVLAGHNTLEKIKALSKQQLEDIEGFADKSAQDFYDSLREKMPLIEELTSLGVNFKEIKTKSSEVSGLKICITGALSEKRSDIEQRIRDYGGVVVSSVSKNTDLLVTNESEPTSSKYKKAIQLKIRIVNEQKLKNLMGVE